MIDLATYLDLCVTDRTSPLHTEDRGDFRMARASLQAFVEWRGETLESTNLLDLALPGWISQFFDYLVDHYESNKSRNLERKAPKERVQWAKRYLKCLRKVVNRAIRYGYLPNIDFFGAIEQAPDFARKQGVEQASLASAQLLQLSKTKLTYRISVTPAAPDDAPGPQAQDAPKAKSSAKGKSKAKSAKAPAAKAQIDYEMTLGAADLYLLCLYCGGMELDDFYQLLDSEIDQHQPVIHLPWAGIDIELSQTIYNALLSYRSMPQFGKRGADVVAQALSVANIQLFQSRSVFVDWLRIAKDQGVSDEHVLRMIEARFNPEITVDQQVAQSIQRVVYRMGASYNKFKKLWYCIYTRRSTGEEKYNELLRLHPQLMPNIEGRRADFYFPNIKDIQVAKVQGQRVVDPRLVLKRYLFVCCSSHEIKAIDQHLDNINVLSRRINGLREYTTVPAAEVYTLQLLLDSIRGTEAEMMLADEDIREAIDTTPLKEQERVRILTPTYQDYEALVIKVKSNSYYSVQLQAIGKSFVLRNVPRALIRRIS